ncbi:hypothetical protein Y1Q_0004214 [Alligator mississippiensis]|uniref:Ig-like domain-containing protein n=1 Tax=Alligator mississippiensis TaxID=8496 RepID=A0A151P6A9_ALLMI|nr:hypothetical protein Y1Q_0004214 [Alligator mississippiensis]
MATVGGKMDAWALRLGALLLPLLFLGTAGWLTHALPGLLEDKRLASARQAEIFTKQIQRLQVTVPDEGLYRCVVGYGTQQHHGETILHLLAAPTLCIPRKPVVADAETSLLCHVGRFYPEDVDVAWLRDGQVLKGPTRSSPQRNADGTFNLTLTYTFTPTRSDTGSVFSCHVHHEALEQPLQEDVSLDIRGESPHQDLPAALTLDTGELRL